MANVLPTGSVFAGYRIEGIAGRGGMGVVYRATQIALDRAVALKLITPDLADDVDFRERFPYHDGYEVVLVGADSLATVQRTHSHYFGRDPNDLDPQGWLTRCSVEAGGSGIPFALAPSRRGAVAASTARVEEPSS